MNVIELFAGCGGLALGLKRAGWDALFAVERDPMAFETLEENMIKSGAPFRGFEQWPNWLPKSNLDIVTMLNDAAMRDNLRGLRGRVDLVAGGPPCQGFSVGGRRDGEDSRNELVFRMLEFVELIQPTAVLIENVEGMARKFISKPGQAKQSIADETVDHLHRLGYQAAYQIVTASDFGVPQIRKRIAIVAVRGEVCDLSALLSETLKQAAVDVRKRHGLPIGRAITTREAIDDLAGSTRVPCPDSAGYDAGTYTVAKSAFAKAMRKGVDSDIPNSHRFTKHGEQVRALYELAHRTQPRGRLSKEFLLSAGTKKDKKVLVDPEAAVQTITTHPDEYIHYVHPRNITVREMARLQSFPDLFTFHGRYTINGPRRKFDVARCSQVGNAVPPLMGEGLGLALKRIIDKVTAGDDNVDVAA